MDKQKLIKLAEELLKAENLENRTEDLLFLKRQHRMLMQREENTFYEKQLTDRFNELFEELSKKEPKLSQSPYEEKKQIIELAKKLLDRKDVVKAAREMDELQLSFKKAGRCSREQDDELWAEFRAVKDEFNKKKRAYFEELEKSNSEKRAKKEDIIERAKALLVIKNLREANEKMEALMNEWKQVGYAGKEDEALWKKFSEVRKEFNQKKKEYHSEIVKQFAERKAKKEELISEAKKLVANAEFTDEELKTIKDLRTRYNKIGFAGKEVDDELNMKFDAVIKQYFEEKKFYTI